MAIRLKNSAFELLAEGYINRFQSGGLVSQDVVKFRKNALQHQYIKDMPGYAERIKQLMESDLILKVGAVKQVRAGSQYGTGPSNLGFLVDVVQETAPSLWSNTITVPIEVLERVDIGYGTPPVPESLKRKERITIKPEAAPVKKYKGGKLTDSKDPSRNLSG